jgi:hypothetical protein
MSKPRTPRGRSKPTSEPEEVQQVEIKVYFRTEADLARKQEILDWIRQRGLDHKVEELDKEVDPPARKRPGR